MYFNECVRTCTYTILVRASFNRQCVHVYNLSSGCYVSDNYAVTTINTGGAYYPFMTVNYLFELLSLSHNGGHLEIWNLDKSIQFLF